MTNFPNIRNISDTYVQGKGETDRGKTQGTLLNSGMDKKTNQGEEWISNKFNDLLNKGENKWWDWDILKRFASFVSFSLTFNVEYIHISDINQ